MAKVFKHVGLWLAVLFAALCTAGLLVVHAQGENNVLYQTVLGKAVNFGITASTLNHNTDLQSNFATKVYTGGGEVNPSLTATPGDFLVGSFKANLTIGNADGNPAQYSTIYTTKGSESNIITKDNKKPTINTDYSQKQINDTVDDMITSALKQGADLATNSATANVLTVKDQNNAIIDTTALGDNDTIYVDASQCKQNLANTGAITINKKPNQNIVFNIKSSDFGSSIKLAKYNIEINGQLLCDSTSDQHPGAEKNKKLATQISHIFFNLRKSSGIKNVELTNTAGVFLIQGADVKQSGVSSGWLVTDGKFDINGNEWHFINPGTPDKWNPNKPNTPVTPTEKVGSLTFTKTFDGHNVTETDKQNIKFQVLDKDNHVVTFKNKDGNKVSEIKLGDMTLTKDSSGKDIYTYTVKDLTPGDYTVTEKNADIEGYNLVFTKTVNGQSADKVTVTSDQTSEINLSDSYTQKPGSLTFTKSFSSNVVKEDLSNITFKVFDKNGNAVTFKDKNGKDVQEIKLGDMTQVNDSNYTYTINNLPWGTYTVRETNSSVAGYTLDTTTSHPESGNVTIDAQQLTGTVDLSDVYTPNTPDTPVTPNHPRVHLYKHEYYNGALTGNRVGGSTYALYRWKGSKASLKLFAMTTRASVAASTDPAKATRADVLNSDNWEYLGEDKTDGNGYVCSKCSGDFKELNDGDIVAAMEMTAPAGYQRTANPAIVQVHADAIPTLLADADGAVSIDKEDGGLIWRETVVRLGIKKVDANGNAVVGAKMEVLDKDGKVVDTWTTTKDNLVHEIDKLTAGETYTLRELQAPEGYEKAADVTFTAEAKDIKGTDEYVQSVTMIDQKAQPAKPGTPSNGTSVKPAQTVAQGVKTGDPTTIGGLVLMFAAAGAVLVLSAKHLKAMR